MDLSENFLKKHIRNNPQSLLFSYYADILLKNEKIDRAYELCKYGVEVNPHFSTGWVIFGKIALSSGQNDFAKTCWLRALAEDRMCLQAAELLLQYDELDLNPDQIFDASSAILNHSRNHKLARKRMKQFTSPKGTHIDTETRLAGKKNTGSAEQGETTREQPTSEKFDIFGLDKDNTGHIQNTFHQIEEKKERGKNQEADPKSKRDQIPEIGNVEKPIASELQAKRDREQDLSASKQKAEEIQLRITPRLATFTFAEVLKSQGLYDQAYEVLEMMRKKNVDKDRIDRKQQELKNLMEQEG